ncbi:putative aldouronate transport system substrate-binding protein [Paenibacillus sp. UNCCL117]|uniref:extracellular solute-binding protein n=1 Tax=unclassified Paenibacillus TaxID=185978 RepID=UPI0008912515|nr:MULTISPECIES: extracellular solute-binding protein [unclassified Paenibacillus]SDC93058.1 putative aldouronate transport system substrate-binding protein [Paenibacillus sp. cl123]SFW29467.1 putative aldouronate transport system substrate-binding protein [Paenibacillus sp. UNCCL117]
MNKNGKASISVALSTILLGGAVLAGCSGQKPEAPAGGAAPGDSSKQEAPAPAKPVKLEVIETGSGLPAPDQDQIKQELDKALGIEMNLTVYASGDDYKNQLNVRMASGNFPDMFAVDRAQLKQYAEQGLLLDLTPYKDKLKTTIDFIGEDSIKKGSLNNKFYAVAKAPNIPYNTFWVRKDWLDKVGMKPPTTIDELLEVSKAFAEKDPDGNGKKDTFGITGGKLGAFNPIFGSFGVGSPNNFYEKDGKVVNAFYDPAFKDALAFIKKIIDTGSVDPELLSNNSTPQYQQKGIKGQAGIMWIDWPNVTKDEFAAQIKAVNPNAEWIQLPALQGPGGQFEASYDIGGNSGLYAIPKSLEKTPEKLNKVIELLNYVSTKDTGSALVQFGIKGKHYNVENGKVVPTELMAKEMNYSWLYQFTGRPEMEYLFVKFAKQAPFIEFANKQPRIKALNGFVDNPNGYNSADALRYIDEELAKFVYGKRPLTEYDAFLKTLETSMNYKVYVDAGMKQLADLGFGKK